MNKDEGLTDDITQINGDEFINEVHGRLSQSIEEFNQHAEEQA